jgi:hypothetical protein
MTPMKATPVKTVPSKAKETPIKVKEMTPIKAKELTPIKAKETPIKVVKPEPEPESESSEIVRRPKKNTRTRMIVDDSPEKVAPPK